MCVLQASLSPLLPLREASRGVWLLAALNVDCPLRSPPAFTYLLHNATTAGVAAGAAAGVTADVTADLAAGLAAGLTAESTAEFAAELSEGELWSTYLPTDLPAY